MQFNFDKKDKLAKQKDAAKRRREEAEKSGQGRSSSKKQTGVGQGVKRGGKGGVGQGKRRRGQTTLSAIEDGTSNEEDDIRGGSEPEEVIEGGETSSSREVTDTIALAAMGQGGRSQRARMPSTRLQK
jgi:hypothetical protein